ncbi:MAG TPA: hypothetical protein VNA17_00245 [Pyrinomonadaceae bacterium]|nr:hypothetical protein [Pyrinomonadaceae bacterium]
MKIRVISFMTAMALLGLFLTGCGTGEQAANSQASRQGDPIIIGQETNPGADVGGEYWAKDNLDLQRVGMLVERSQNAEEFERYLNDEGGINNLDLNGDGYVDYISVEEFDDRGGNERGLSLFTRFGPDLIQEVATILFQRDEPRWPGARVYVRGNEQIYGDNVYYETNWADKALGLVSNLFGDGRERYVSPYYYDNYPADYQVYEVVGTPVYRTRVESVFPQPVFVPATAPIATRVKIKSPNDSKKMDKIFARLANPTVEQVEFIKNNPRRNRGRDDVSERRESRQEERREDRQENRREDRRTDDGKPGRSGDDKKPGKDSDGKPGKGGDKGGKKKPE